VSILIDIVRAWIEAPKGALSLLIGSGGLIYLLDRWLNRPKIALHLRDVGLNSVVLEVENQSDKSNSIGRSVLIDGINLFGERQSFNIEVPDTDRELQPFKPRRLRLSVHGEHSLDSPISLDYVVLRLEVSRGRRSILRCRRLDNPTSLHALPFFVGRWLCVLRGRLRARRGNRAFAALAQARRHVQAQDDNSDPPEPAA